MDKEREF
jgi:regulator of replication initiation timing